MKRVIIVFMLLASVMAPVFSTDEWSGTSTQAFGYIEAYKDLPPAAMMNFNIVISNSKRTEIAGSSMSDQIVSTDLSNNEMANALTISISTNRRNPVLVSLWFSPFTSTADTGNKMVKTTWKKKSVTVGDYIWHENVQEGDPPETVERFFRVGDSRYRYKLSVSIKSKGSTVTQVVAEKAIGAEMDISFTPTAQVSVLNNNGGWSGWTDTADIPETETGVLPGMWEGCTQQMTASVQLSMTMGTSIGSLLANRRYTATVRITIQGD